MQINDIRVGYKILTHDWKPPIQGGTPLCNGTFPIILPPVELDISSEECASGYNYTNSLREAAKIASFWPTGRPAKCLVVSASEDAIQRGDKRRCSQLTLERLCTEVEIKQAMRDLVKSWADDYTELLVKEQWLWYEALGRSKYDKDLVMISLQKALDIRGLDWSLEEYSSVYLRDARDAWAAWDAWDARAAWDARVAWNARAARDAWDAWNARAARDAWTARDAWDARVAWDAKTAWDAWNALILNVAVSLFNLQGYSANYLTTGLRDAYLNGLDVAIPTGPKELGWQMISTNR